MYVRALIVVLAILNTGVALWWGLRPSSPPPLPPSAPSGVASLQLIAAPKEVVAAAAPEAAPPPTAAPAPGPAGAASEPAVAAKTVASAIKPASDLRCLSFGPYPSRDGAEATRMVAGPLLSDARVREVTGADASSFRVMLTSVGNREQAQALVARIKAAGIGDYYVIGQGDNNDVALGQYRSREGAERRQSELAAKGFSADVLPSGGSGQSRWWLEARTAADDAALRALRAPGQRSRDCAALR